MRTVKRPESDKKQTPQIKSYSKKTKLITVIALIFVVVHYLRNVLSALYLTNVEKSIDGYFQIQGELPAWVHLRDTNWMFSNPSQSMGNWYQAMLMSILLYLIARHFGKVFSTSKNSLLSIWIPTLFMFVFPIVMFFGALYGASCTAVEIGAIYRYMLMYIAVPIMQFPIITFLAILFVVIQSGGRGYTQSEKMHMQHMKALDDIASVTERLN